MYEKKTLEQNKWSMHLSQYQISKRTGRKIVTPYVTAVNKKSMPSTSPDIDNEENIYIEWKIY